MKCEKDIEDNQPHLLTCLKINGGNEIISEIPNYDNLFSQNVTDQANITLLIRQRLLKRRQILKNNVTKNQPQASVDQVMGGNPASMGN